MALTEALRLLITADTAGAVQGIDKVGKASQQADKHVKSSQSSLDKWGRGLTTAGAGMVAFGAVALAGLGHAAKASEEANLSQVKLRNTLANMPKLAGESSKSFTDLAQKIQGYSAADGDAIVAAEAMLGTFNLTGREIRQITPLVVDYSRKFGVDMVSAATQVGKALDGNVGALKRNGVSIDEAMFKTDRYGAVQKALSDQVGGFARAEGATFAGSLERMKNELGDLEEGVGKGAVEAFGTLFGAVNKAAGALEKLSPSAQSVIGKFATFGAVGLTAAGGLSMLIGQAMLARERFAAAASAVSGFTGKLGGLGGVGAFTGAAVGIGLLTAELERMGDEADRRTLDKVTSQLERMQGAFSPEFADRIRAWAKAARESDTDFVFKNFSKVLDDSVPAARRFVDVVDHLDASTKKLIGAGTIEKMHKAVAEKAEADKAGAAAQSAYTDETLRGADAMSGEADATDEATAALQDYEDKLRALMDPLFGMQDALEGNVKAQGDVAAKQLEAVAAQNAYTDAVKKHGPRSKEAADASLKLSAAQQALTEANTHAVRSAEDVDFAIQELRAEIKKNPAALDQAKAKLESWRHQGLITGDQAKATARKFDDLAGSIRRTPGSKRIPVSTPGINSAQVRLANLKSQLDRFPTRKNVEIHFAATGVAAVSIAEAKLLRRAGGGPISPRDAYIVGEHGPELFVSDRAGQIIPNDSLVRPQSFGRAAAMSGGVAVVNNNHFHMEGAIVSSKADAQRWVADAWNKAAANRMVNVRGRPL